MEITAVETDTLTDTLAQGEVLNRIDCGGFVVYHVENDGKESFMALNAADSTRSILIA